MAHISPSFSLRLAPGVMLLASWSMSLAFFTGRASAEERTPLVLRPNVLFLAFDDMNDWVGCLGGYDGAVHTPNIDRLAQNGALFANAHCVSPKCAPSRAALMTGLRPSTTGLYENAQWWFPNLPDVVTLPQQFRRQGYRVVGAGKIFHHTAGNNPPNQWDDYLPLLFRNDPWFRASKGNYPWSKSGPNPPGFPFSEVKGLGSENDWGSLPIEDTEYDDVLTADYAVQFLQRKQDEPFFLACGIYRPHLPWYAPASYFEQYPLDAIKTPPVEPDDLSDVPPIGRRLAAAGRDDLNAIRSADRWKEAIRAYLASISFADAQVGRVLNALAASPHAKNTLVVLWSDHGWHLGQKDHWHKSTLWEEATRVPLIIAGPGITPGRREQPVSLIDLYPSLCALCSLKPPANLDGLNLEPLLKDASSAWSRPAVIEYRRGNAAVRSERYRYIRYADGGEELYDHQTDPNEWTNLANDPQYASFKADMSKWITATWADEAPSKSAFHFDPETYRWIEKATGRVIEGK